MALSGSLNTTAYESRYLTLSWTATQSIENNKSTISWTLKGAGGSTTRYYTSAPFKVVIDGVTVYESSTRIDVYNGTIIASGTKDITHNNDGKRSFTASVTAAIYYSTNNVSGSGSWELNQIPRAATITNAPNFTDEDNPTITYNNMLGSNVTTLQACISLTGAIDDIVYRDISKTGTTYTFNLTDAERAVLRNATTTANTRKVSFFIKTVIGGNTYYHGIDRTLTITNAQPTINPTITDTNTKTVALTGDSNKLIRYYSTANITFGASAKKGATIKSKKVVCGGGSLTADGSIAAIESGDFTFTITDSRGNTLEKTISKSIVPYTKLTCNLVSATADLAEDNTTTINYELNGNYYNGSFGTTNNVLTLWYRIKESGNSEWQQTQINITPTITNNTYTCNGAITGLDYTKTYTVEFMTQDKIFGAYANYAKSEQKTLSTKPIFDWSKEDFNFNVPVSINGTEVLRHTEDKNTVLSAASEIYLRPNTVNSTTGEVRLKNDGTLVLSKALPFASGGTGATTAAGARTNLGLGAKGDTNTPIYMASSGVANCNGNTLAYQTNTVSTNSTADKTFTVNGTIVACFITMKGDNNSWAIDLTINANSGAMAYSCYGRINSSVEEWGMNAYISDGNKVVIHRYSGATTNINCYCTTIYIPN